MGFEERVTDQNKNIDQDHGTRTMAVHSFSDLTHVSPVAFLYLLKECYIHGTCKATKKFRALQQHVFQVLSNGPQPGPATFVVYCLYALPIFEFHCEGLSHLITSALRRRLKVETILTDSMEAKDLAAQLYLDIVGGFFGHDEKIVVKILEVFDVQLTNIEKATCLSKSKNSCGITTAKAFIEQYIFGLIEAESYMSAVALLEHFSIRQSGQALLLVMMDKGQFKAAEKWATFIGKPMLSVLVEELVSRNKLKFAYGIIKNNNLQHEFPEIYQKCQESSLKKLAEREFGTLQRLRQTKTDIFLNILVYLAMEAGYSEKVDELCERYSLEGFVNAKVPEATFLHSRYLNLKDLALEGIVWVDDADGLHKATCHLEECKVVGLDCEWKPNYEKGSKPNKVSIIQIASEKLAFVLDLIKLSEAAPEVLDNCLTRILQSPRILKLGYNFQCDIKQLACSYDELECFKHYEMLLDVQKVFKEPRGGLSGLAQKILGAGLNKTRRNSNWEQRPLTSNQLEYAALDAAAVVHIFSHIRNHSQPASVGEGHEKIEWKSKIVSHLDNIKKAKKDNNRRKKDTRT